MPSGASSAPPVGSLLTGPFGGSASAGFHPLRLAGNWRAPAYFILIAASYDMLLLSGMIARFAGECQALR